MDDIRSVYELPDVSFIDNDTLDAMMQRLVKNYERRYEQVTGTAISLSAADPVRIQLYAIALDLYQIEQYIDRAGKQDLLKYSYGEFLEHLAGGRGITRNQATAAKTTLRFTLSEPKAYAVGIPVGTRATNGDGVYFRTMEYGEVPIGQLYADVPAVCTVLGIGGNGFLEGQIDFLVDPLPYVREVSNVTPTDGGTDMETDEHLAQRAFLAPSGYSTAGPDDAYIFWTLTYNTNIGSVLPTSPTPCKVEVYILMADGSMPTEEIIKGLEEYLRQQEIRPLTDQVEVKAPAAKEFDIDLTYYIDRSHQSSAAAIQAKVAEAVDSYVSWQTTQIGRDIEPAELIRRVREAGAKNPELKSPAFTRVADAEVARLGEKTVTYGGLEDD